MSPGRTTPRTVERRSVAGAIAVLKRGSKPCVAMMLDPYGKWTCPKGRIEEGETAEEAAIREAREELRLTGLRLLGRAGKARYRFKEGTKEIAVAADWFILVAQRPQRLHRSAEAVKAEWVDLEEAVRRAGYSNVRLMLRRTARLLPK